MVLEAGKITEEGLQRLRDRLGTFNRPRQYGVGLFNEYASGTLYATSAKASATPTPSTWMSSTPARPSTAPSSPRPAFLYSVYWTSGRTGD